MLGFYLMGLSPRTLEVKAYRPVAWNVARVSSCHWRGDAASDIFREHFGKRYFPCGAGSGIALPHPGIRNFELESPSVK